MSEPRHLHKTHLSCNSPACRAHIGSPKDQNGNRLLHKFLETNLVQVNEEHCDVYCLHCGNWLCGDTDAFGDLNTVHISIMRIKHCMDILQRTATKTGRYY